MDNAKADVVVSLSGKIHVECVDEFSDPISTIAIDDLIARDPTPEMLEDEPELLQMLDQFEGRLRRSLDLVAAARQ